MNQNRYDEFILAIQLSQIDEVKRLIPLCNPKHNDSAALWHAATIGNVECLQLLVPVCDPKASNSLALRCALYYQHTDCVVLLHPLSNVKTALKYLNAEYDDIDWGQRLDTIAAQYQQRVLNAAVKPTTLHRTKKI